MFYPNICKHRKDKTKGDFLSMKHKLRSTLALLGGATAGLVGSQAGSGSTVHAATKNSVVNVKVHKGNTTWNIAKKYKASLKQVVKDNKLAKNGAKIYAGQKLKVKKGSKFKADLPIKDTKSTKSKAKTTTQAVTAQKQTTTPATTASSNLSFSTSNDTANNNVQPTAYKTSSAAKTTKYSSPVSGSEASAKAWIAQHESTNNYNAQNGRYYGKYQLDLSYLHGDLSPANQEKVADNYVKNRYGSWTAAQQFWQSHNWY